MTTQTLPRVNCPQCGRSVQRQLDGTLKPHRGWGWRCPMSNQTPPSKSPDWLTAIADARAAGMFPQPWRVGQVAAHLEITPDQARTALDNAYVRPIGEYGSGSGRAYLYDPLDIENLRLHGFDHRKPRRPPKYSSQAERLRAGRNRRLAARQLIEGRLVAVEAREHGSASTYGNHGCRCKPCTDAHMVRMNERKRARK